MSRNLYNTEEHHLHLRLLTAIEAALHLEFYNTQRDDYQDLVLDNRQVHDPYNLLMKSIATPGGFSELLVIFAASAALSIGIQSYCPSTFNTEFLAEPMSRNIYGRGVHNTKATAATIMWSMTFVPQRLHEFRPNHFVVLYPKDKPQQCHIDLKCTPARNNSVHELNDDEWPSLSSTKISSPAMIQHTPVISSDSRRKRIANLKVSPTLHP